MLGFAPSLRFLRSQILCRLYKRPSDETKPRPPPPSHVHAKNIMHVKDPVHHVRVQWIMATPKQVITRHALKVSVHNAEVGHYTKVKKKLTIFLNEFLHNFSAAVYGWEGGGGGGAAYSVCICTDHTENEMFPGMLMQICNLARMEVHSSS